MNGFVGGGHATDSEGYAHPLRRFPAALSSALNTRLELLVTELEEERERLKQSLILTLVLFFGLSLGIILVTIFVVAIFWQGGWVYALGVLAVLYLGIGVGAGVMLRKTIATRPPFLSASLAELSKDRDRLRTASRE
jgi:uncharacterized membrane protein YqjE